MTRPLLVLCLLAAAFLGCGLQAPATVPAGDRAPAQTGSTNGGRDAGVVSDGDAAALGETTSQGQHGPDHAPSVASPSDGPGPDDSALRRELEGARPVGTLRGRASHYSDSLAGKLTASGEPYDPAAFTAAHPSLPFGTIVRVRRPGKPDDVYVRINDRGPFGRRGGIIDLSRAAAIRIDLVRPGVADVIVEIMKLGAAGDRSSRSWSRGRR